MDTPSACSWIYRDMKNNVQTQNQQGLWVEAVEEPYHPNLFEKVKHRLGIHCYYQSKACLICGKYFYEK